MPLPMPDQYDDWRDWASAIMQVLGASDNEVVAGAVSTTVVPAPAGYHPIWMNDTAGTVWAGNPYGTAPVAADLVFIDTAAIADAAIETQNVADLAISTAKIANAAIVSAKIGDLQVVTAKIGDLAVNNAKIANLAVASANIQDLAVTQAKVGLLAVGSAQIIDLAVSTAKIADAAILTAKIGDAQVGTAQIAVASISTALIQNAAIVQALIAAAAIGTAQIQDAAITSAKILDLVIDKVTAGTLDAEIDMGSGLIRFTIGGNQLTLGKGFGTTNQFIMWFGPAMAENLMTEAAALFYLKVDGSAYFGGSLSAGTLSNSIATSDLSATAEVQLGPFGTNGNPKNLTLSYNYFASADRTTACPAPPWDIPDAQVKLYKGVLGDTSTLMATLNVVGTADCVDGSVSEPGYFSTIMGSSITVTDSDTSTSDFTYWAKIISRNNVVVGSTQQRLAIASVEQ